LLPDQNPFGFDRGHAMGAEVLHENTVSLKMGKQLVFTFYK